MLVQPLVLLLATTALVGCAASAPAPSERVSSGEVASAGGRQASEPEALAAPSPNSPSPPSALSSDPASSEPEGVVNSLCAEIDEGALQGRALIGAELGPGGASREQLEAALVRVQSVSTALQGRLAAAIQAEPELERELQDLRAVLGETLDRVQSALAQLQKLSAPQRDRLAPVVSRGIAGSVASLTQRGMPACAGLISR